MFSNSNGNEIEEATNVLMICTYLSDLPKYAYVESILIMIVARVVRDSANVSIVPQVSTRSSWAPRAHVIPSEIEKQTSSAWQTTVNARMYQSVTASKQQHALAGWVVVSFLMTAESFVTLRRPPSKESVEI